MVITLYLELMYHCCITNMRAVRLSDHVLSRADRGWRSARPCLAQLDTTNHCLSVCLFP